MASQRYLRGIATLRQFDGKTGPPILAPLAEVAPGLARHIVEFVFGEIFAKRALDPKSREIAALACLAALGDTGRQLQVHIGNALKVGCSRQEVVEVLVQTAVFAGFPRAMNALFTARELFIALDTAPPTARRARARSPRRRGRRAAG